jgi:CheY-like chemotaxis protein
MISWDADVLLAEDNPSDAELILEMLRELVDPSPAHRCTTGVEALDFLARADAGALERLRSNSQPWLQLATSRSRSSSRISER